MKGLTAIPEGERALGGKTVNKGQKQETRQTKHT
jgi:hypothetical protein